MFRINQYREDTIGEALVCIVSISFLSQKQTGTPGTVAVQKCRLGLFLWLEKLWSNQPNTPLSSYPSAIWHNLINCIFCNPQTKFAHLLAALATWVCKTISEVFFKYIKCVSRKFVHFFEITCQKNAFSKCKSVRTKLSLPTFIWSQATGWFLGIMSTDIYKLQEMGLDTTDTTCSSCHGNVSPETQKGFPTT